MHRALQSIQFSAISTNVLWDSIQRIAYSAWGISLKLFLCIYIYEPSYSVGPS